MRLRCYARPPRHVHKVVFLTNPPGGALAMRVSRSNASRAPARQQQNKNNHTARTYDERRKTRNAHSYTHTRIPKSLYGLYVTCVFNDTIIIVYYEFIQNTHTHTRNRGRIGAPCWRSINAHVCGGGACINADICIPCTHHRHLLPPTLYRSLCILSKRN